MENFFKNRAKIQAKNANHTKARFEIDGLADLSDDEFIKQKTGARLGRDHPDLLKNTHDNDRRFASKTNNNKRHAPIREVDWTHKMTAVRD